MELKNPTFNASFDPVPILIERKDSIEINLEKVNDLCQKNKTALDEYIRIKQKLSVIQAVKT